jgi:SAM-dependent methyltransferase
MERMENPLSGSVDWTERAEKYADEIASDYHSHRLEVIRALLPDLRGKTVVDFGCGEGVLIREARKAGAASIIGIDPVADLLSKATEADTLIQGGADKLSTLPDKSVDCLIAANVLAYLTPEEEWAFYLHAARIVRGCLVVTHSNELFDLFTLNAYTVAFFQKHFGVDVWTLLRRWDQPKDTILNIRENPLTYPTKLLGYGFRQDRMEFINFHETPPLLTKRAATPSDIAGKSYPRTLDWPEADRWKLMFQCSMFGVRAVSR